MNHDIEIIKHLIGLDHETVLARSQQVKLANYNLHDQQRSAMTEIVDYCRTYKSPFTVALVEQKFLKYSDLYKTPVDCAWDYLLKEILDIAKERRLEDTLLALNGKTIDEKYQHLRDSLNSVPTVSRSIDIRSMDFNQGIVSPVTFGIKPMDDAAVLYEGNYIFLVGRPKSFKTTMLLHCFLQQAMRGINCLYITFEQSEFEIGSIFKSMFLKMDVRQFRTDPKKFGIDLVPKVPGQARILYCPPNLVETVRDEISQANIKAVFFDGLYMGTSKKWDAQAELIQATRLMVADTRTVGFFTTQLNRNMEVAFSDAYNMFCTGMYSVQRVIDGQTEKPTNSSVVKCIYNRNTLEGESFKFGKDYTNEMHLIMDSKSTSLSFAEKNSAVNTGTAGYTNDSGEWDAFDTPLPNPIKDKKAKAAIEV